jgi:hypothetical protein
VNDIRFAEFVMEVTHSDSCDQLFIHSVSAVHHISTHRISVYGQWHISVVFSSINDYMLYQVAAVTGNSDFLSARIHLLAHKQSMRG